MAEAKSETKPAAKPAEPKATPASTGAEAKPKEGDLTGPLEFKDPHTGEPLETETVATYEEGAEAGFVGTKPKDET
jgi:hypothetical protein